MDQAAEKIALVTGAGSGIGREVSLALLRRGYRLVLTGRNIERLKETASLAKDNADRCLCISCDIAQPQQVEHLFEEINKAYGRLDVLFNNAGIFSAASPIEDVSYEQWKNVVDVNLTGAFLCAQQAIRLMKKQNPSGGRIINNGSISSQVPRPDSVPYTTTKHAITGLTKCISLEGRRHNIACGQIDIGNAETSMTANMPKGVQQANGEIAPEPVMDIEHVAEAVLHMAELPLESNIQFMTIMATKMPFIGRG
ncbi:MAG: SDR family oxidoreductase [Gammaproteobacteria bacterium]|nr:SDR family oxidoreductase [Gammaproteobacteria bacterium]